MGLLSRISGNSNDSETLLESIKMTPKNENSFLVSVFRKLLTKT